MGAVGVAVIVRKSEVVVELCKQRCAEDFLRMHGCRKSVNISEKESVT